MSDLQIYILIVFACSVPGFYWSMSLVNALRKVPHKDYDYALKKYAVVLGSVLLLLHTGYQYFSGNIPDLSKHPLEFVGTFLCAYLVALSIINAAIKKNLPLKELMYAASAASLSGYLLAYLFHIASGATDIRIDIVSAVLALFIAFMTSALAIVTMLWLKAIHGKSLFRLKLLFAFELAMGFLATHAAINLSILHSIAHVPLRSDLTGDYVAMLMVLAPVLLLLTSFILVLFYERNVEVTESRLRFQSTSIAERKALHHDPLTNLPNRDALNTHLLINAKRCDRLEASMALSYIDLDYFKPINDQFGHHIGDLLLIEVAKRIGQAIRNCDYVARVGGDEFIVVLTEIDNHQSVVTVLQRIIDSLREPFVIEEHVLEISCSIGVSIYPRDGNLQKLMMNADAAMYKAKQNGKNQYRFFDAEIEQASDEMQQTRVALKQAIAEHQFKLLFQPKVDALTRRVIGAEALLRWEHPSRGLLSPNAFIDAAERFGMIEDINAWVISQACSTIKLAEERGIALCVSVNLSNQQFRNKHLSEHIQAILENHGVSPAQLILEVSETNAIHYQAQFKDTLRLFRSLGIKVSLDDFGLHPFSFSNLKSMEIDEIKLDRTLTRYVATHAVDLAIVDAIVKLGHALKLNVVAEGVEEEEQALALIKVGCNQLQGFLFAKPVERKLLFEVFDQLSAHTAVGNLFK